MPFWNVHFCFGCLSSLIKKEKKKQNKEKVLYCTFCTIPRYTSHLFVWLSIRNVPVWALPPEIRGMAHAISGRIFDHDFIEWFLPQYTRGRGRQNLAVLVLSAAQFLIDVFSDVWMKQGQTQKIPRGRKKYQVHVMSVWIIQGIFIWTQ